MTGGVPTNPMTLWRYEQEVQDTIDKSEIRGLTDTGKDLMDAKLGELAMAYPDLHEAYIAKLEQTHQDNLSQQLEQQVSQ